MMAMSTKGREMGTPVRRWLVMAGMWLVVVLAVASLTWFVIGRAGRDVGIAQVAVPAGTVSSMTPTPAPATSTARPTPTESEDAHETPDATHSEGTGSTPRSTPRHTTSTPRTTAVAHPPAPGPTARRATFSTQGGTVTASCTGSTIRLVSATPRDGYRLHQDVAEGALEVTFTSGYGDGEGDGEHEDLKLHIVCQGGIPVEHH